MNSNQIKKKNLYSGYKSFPEETLVKLVATHVDAKRFNTVLSKSQATKSTISLFQAYLGGSAALRYIVCTTNRISFDCSFNANQALILHILYIFVQWQCKIS